MDPTLTMEDTMSFVKDIMIGLIEHLERTQEAVFRKAIISGDPAKLEQLIHSQNLSNHRINPRSARCLSKTLAVIYEELKVTNVPLNQAMEYMIVQKITESRFFTKRTSELKQNVKMTLEDIQIRISLTIFSINLVIKQYSKKSVDDVFVHLCQAIQKHMYILKYYLKKTYAKLPWEEMSFCLINFVSTIVKPTEVDDIYKLVLDKARLLNHLSLFAETLKNIPVTEKDINPKIRLGKRSRIMKDIINSNKEFEKLYYDYDLIKDVFSLRRIDFYAGVVANLDFKEDIQLDKLAIERALQVIGEALKSSPESPNVSDEINRILQTTSPKLKELSTSVRDALSHADVLEKITLFEDNESTDFFLELKKEIIELQKVVNDALQKRKLCAFLAFIQKITHCRNLAEAKELSVYVNHLQFDDYNYKDIIIQMIEKTKSKIDAISKLIENNITPMEEYMLKEIYHIIDKQRVTTVLSVDSQGHCLTMKEYRHLIVNSNNLASLRGYFQLISRYLSKNIEDLNKGTKNMEVICMLGRLSESVHRRGDCNNIEFIDKLIKLIGIDILFSIGKIEGLEKFQMELKSKPELKNVTREIDSVIEDILNNSNVTLHGDSLIKSYQKKKTLSKNKTILLSLLDELSKNLNRQSEIQDCIELFKQLGQKRTTEESFIQNFEQGKFDVCRNNIVSKVDDSFSVLLKNFSDSNTFMYEKRKVSLQLFLKSLGLKENQVKGIVEYYTTESKNQIKNYFNKRLNILKVILDCDNISKTTQIFSENKRLQLATELLVLDLSNILENASRFVDDKLLIEDFSPLLLGKSLRNYLAHGNILIDNLPYNPRLSIIANAFVFIREGDTLLDREDVLIGRHVKNTSSDFSYYMLKATNCLQNRDLFFMAAKKGRPQDVEEYLKKGININSRNLYGSTVLYFAILSDNIDTFKYLLSMNADINATDICNNRLLVYVVLHGSVKILKYYLTNNLPLNLRNNEEFTLLHLAVDAGRAEVVEVLIDYYLDLNIRYKGMTPLHIAANLGHEEILKTLIKAGADIGCLSSSGKTALDFAIENGHANIVKLLLTKSAKINMMSKNKEYRTVVLYRAVKGECFDLIIDLLEGGVNVNELDNTGHNSLHHACIHGKDRVVKFLIKQGARVNITSSNGNTPLSISVSSGHKSIVEILLENGAEVSSADSNSALHRAVSNASTDIVEMLLGKSADINTVHNGRIPLHVASLLGHRDIVDLLLKSGTEVDAKTLLNQTSLYLASANGHVDVVASLLTHGADINFKSNGDCTALHEACLNGLSEVVLVLLKDQRVIADAKTNTGHTPLHLAAQKGNTNIFSNLLDKGADINARTNTGHTPLMFAILQKKREVVKLLLSKGADANLSLFNGLSTFNLACNGSKPDIVRLLLEYVDVKFTDHEDIQMLLIASIRGDLDLVRILLENGASANLSCDENYTPLLYATTYGHLRLANELVKNGADMLARTIYKHTVVHMAVIGGKEEMLRWILEELKSKNELELINKQTQDGDTALLISVDMEFHDITKILLQYGADIDICNSEGVSPLHKAKEKEDVRMIRLLTSHKISQLQ